MALYTLANPTGVAKKQKSFLQKWDQNTGMLIQVAAVDESLAALAVRDDGRFVAVGTMFSGSVSIYIAFSLQVSHKISYSKELNIKILILQRVLNVHGAHSMFVTGLEFLPVATDEHTITNLSEAAVVSISVDNRVCVHSLPYRNVIPPWVGITSIVLTLFFTFLICSYLGI